MPKHWVDDNYTEDDEYATPKDLLRDLDRAVGGFNLGAASGAEDHYLIPNTLTKEDNALLHPWAGKVYLNPPYSRKLIPRFVKKAYTQATHGPAEVVVCLVPVRTSADWWQEWAMRATTICYIDHRLKFEGKEHHAPFDNAILVYGEPPKRLLDLLDMKGHTQHRPEVYEREKQKTLDVGQQTLEQAVEGAEP